MATAALVRPWLGISPSAWEEAIEAFGPEDAAVVLAAILQRSSLINSAGGYLRNLTEKARAGPFPWVRCSWPDPCQSTKGLTKIRA